MGNSYQILEWDTAFFDFIVAKIIPYQLTLDKLEDILALLKKQNVSLVYWASDPSDIESQRSAKLIGGFLADKRVTYLVDLRNVCGTCSQNVDVNIGEYPEDLPNSELEVLALKAGVFSRFNIDPKFSKERYENLYKQWIINSTNKKIADAVFVARDGCKIIGMITVGRKNCCGSIGLIAVDENRRGKNVGVSLVSAAHKWFVSHGCKIAQVVTQTDNIAACKLYNKCGYHIEKTEHLYHFWL